MPFTLIDSLALKFIGGLLLWVLPISIQTNSGEKIQGDLDGFSENSLLLNQSGRVAQLAFDDIATLRPEDAEEKTGPPIRVRLVGGSLIAAQDVQVDGGKLALEPRRQNRLSIPVDQVKSIRFRPASVDTDPEWLGILDSQRRGDTLVIRRPGNRLDPQQGIVLSIEQGKVQFDLEGTVVGAPIDRLEGVIFGGVKSVTEDADIQVTDAYGSRWSAISIEPSRGDQPLQLHLAPGLVHEVPLHQVIVIRWSGGVATLASLPPASQSLKPYFQTGVESQLFTDLFGTAVHGEADLVIHGGTSIEYRLPPGYQVFAGTVARDSQIATASSVTVRIHLDGKVLWQKELLDAAPRGFELPLEDARRLSIEVDSGDDGDLGDTVFFSRPRLLK